MPQPYVKDDGCGYEQPKHDDLEADTACDDLLARLHGAETSSYNTSSAALDTERYGIACDKNDWQPSNWDDGVSLTLEAPHHLAQCHVHGC